MKGILVELRDTETHERLDFTTLSSDAAPYVRLNHAHRMRRELEVNELGVYVVEKEVDYDTKEMSVLNKYNLREY